MIICCGEALIDMLPRAVDGKGETNGFLPVTGGAIFNTAIALGRLGTKTALLGGISNDMFGEQLMAGLTASNVGVGLCFRSNQPTTLAFVELIEGVANYSFFDENSAMRMFSEENTPPIPKETSALQFGGISLTVGPSAAAYEAVLNQAATSVIAIDPNIRTGFIKDGDAYRARLQRMISQSDIIKVSDEDFAWMHPDEGFDEIANGWIKQGASLVILTMGKNGSRAITRSDDFSIAAQSVEVVDTVGAGDAFNAGVLFDLQSNCLLTKKALAKISKHDAERAVDFATSVAAHTVSQAGANPPWLSEVGG
ncbi:MAG: carbohydrate kinase [Rhizobiaceae bacterium]